MKHKQVMSGVVVLAASIGNSLHKRRVPHLRERILILFFTTLILSFLTGNAFAQRAFASRFNTNAKGDIAFVSNTLMTCPTSANCTSIQNAANGVATPTPTNNSYAMIYIDTDADATTFNSSSAQYAPPAGSSVLWAGLYWAGDSANAARNTVLLKTPGSATYTSLAADQLDTLAGANVYQGFKNVTTQVALAGPGNYTVANVQSSPGVANVYAGWTLVVVYGNSTLPTRNLAVYDGYQRVNSATPGGAVDISLSGFITPPIGPVSTTIGTIGYDGDRTSVEGTAGLQFGPTTAALKPVFNAANPQNDYFNSTISFNGADVTTRSPAYLNTLGYDADLSKPNTPLPNSTTSAVVRVSSSSETIDLGVVTLATDIFVPNVKDTLTKKVTDVNGGVLLPGEIIEYELSFGNAGQDPAINTFLTDKIPANTTYVPGSIVIVSGANAGAMTDAAGDDQAEYDAVNKQILVRAGVGATATKGGTMLPGDPFIVIRFRVTVNAGTPGDTIISNSGAVTSTAQTLGTTTTDISDSDSTQAGDQPATIIVASPDLTITKTHAGDFAVGQTGATYTITVANNGTAPTVAGVPVVVNDTLPTGLTATAIAGTGWTCSLSPLSCQRSDALALGASYPPITITVNVAANAAASVINSTTVSGGGEGASKVANNTAKDPTNVVQGFPTSKSFTPSAVSTNQPSVLAVTVTNGTSAAFAGLAVNDILPSGVVVAPTPNASSAPAGCAGTFAPAANATVVSSTGGTVPANGTCVLRVDVVSAQAGSYVNTIPTGNVTTTNAGSNQAAASATLTVAAPDLQIAKAATTTTFYQGQSNATFTIDVRNTGSGGTFGAVTVTDTLAAGLTAVSASGTGWSCSVSANTITCSRADTLLAASAYPSITVIASVAANATTPISNTANVAGGGEPVANAANNSATVSVPVLQPLTATKSFTPLSINLGETSVLNITLTNPNAVAITGAAFTDTYPTNLVNAATPAASSTCLGATLTAAAAASSLSLSGATVPANGSCTAQVTVTLNAAGGAGSYTNTLPAGAVTAANTGPSAVAASATLAVAAPDLVLAKTHVGDFFIGQTGATYTLEVRNVGAGATNGSVITVVDTLPTGYTYTGFTGTGWNCSAAGQVVTCTTNAVIAVGGAAPALSLIVNVDASAALNSTNNATVSGGGESAASQANNSAADLTKVLRNPRATKDFSPTSGNIGVPTALTITLINDNDVAINGLSFTDTFPTTPGTGLTVLSSSLLANTCSGTAANTATSVSLSGGTIPANSSCTLRIQVVASAAGNFVNTIAAAAITSTNAGSNTVAASASFAAQSPDLAISKTTNGANFYQGQNGASYTIRVANIGVSALAAGATTTVTETPPAGMTIVSMSGTNWTCAAPTCTRTDGLAAGANFEDITVTVNIAANASTPLNNVASVSNPNEPAANAAANNTVTAATEVLVNPTVAKSFSPTQMFSGDISTITITLSNPNAVPLAITTLTDTLPTGLTAAASPNTSTSCGGIANIVSNILTLSGGSIPANSSCAVKFDVTSVVPGVLTNTIPAGGLVTSNGGSNTAPASASLTIFSPDLVVSKTHSGSFFQGQVGAQYVITVTNIGLAPSNGAVTITDTLPAGLQASSVAAVGTGWNCGATVGTAVSCTRAGIGADALAAGGAYPPVTVTFNVGATAASSTNTAAVSGGGEAPSLAGNNSVSDATTVLTPLQVSKAFTPSTLVAGNNTSLSITLSNVNTTAINPASFSDTFPPQITIAGSATLTPASCGGTITAATGTSTVQVTGITVAGNSQCVFTVPVTATSVGAWTNTIASTDVSPNIAAAASATLTVNAPNLAVTKAKIGGTFFAGQIGAQYRITVNNVGNAPTTGAVVNLTDTLPTGLTATAISGTGWTCPTGALTSPVTCTRTDALASAAAYPDVILTVNVASTLAGNLVNSVSVSGGGEVDTSNNTATDSVLVLRNPNMTKRFAATSIAPNAPTTLTITLSNSNTAAITGVALTDNFPATPGLMTAANTPTTTCGGTVSVLSGNTGVALTGGSIPANSSCTISVDVTAGTSGTYNNIIPAANLTTTNAGAGTVDATDALTVAAPDMIVAKRTLNAPYFPGQTNAQFELSVSNIGNTNFVGGTLLTVTDTFPAGLTPTAFNGTGWSCTIAVPVVTCTRSDALAQGASYPPLTLTASVAANAAASLTNSATVSGGGDNNATNNTVSTPFAVLRSPTISKAFAPPVTTVNSPVQLAVTLSNPNAVALTGAAFTDNLPANMQVAATPNAVSACGGTVTATAAANNFSLTGGSIPAQGSCVVRVSVVVINPGVFDNVIPAGALVTTNGGASQAAATATLEVSAPDLQITKLNNGPFYQGQTTGATYTLKISNQGSAPTTAAIEVQDTLPGGLKPTAVNAAAPWACSIAGQVVNCTHPGTGGFTILAAGSAPDIVISIEVARDAAVSTVNSAKVAGGGEPPAALINNTADSTTAILQNPTVAKRFLPAGISLGQTATMEIAITNPNAVAITGVGVTDPYPTNLVNAAAPNASSSCGGTLTAAANGTSLTLAGASIPAQSTCIIKADVTTTAIATPGGYVNTIAKGAVTSTNAGDNFVGSSGTLTVATPDLVITKTHTGDFYQRQTAAQGAQYLLTVSNQGNGNTLGLVTVSDTLPAGFSPTSAAGTGWTCAIVAQVVTCTRSDVLASASSWPVITVGVTIAANATSATNSATVEGGGESAAVQSNNRVGDATTVLVNPTIAKAFSTATSPINTPFNLTITLTNTNAIALTGAAVIDAFPTGLSFATPNNAATTCGGTVTANTTANSLAITGGIIPANANCTITAQVIATQAGVLNNVIAADALTTTNGGANQAAATQTVTAFVTEPTGFKVVRLTTDQDGNGLASSGDSLEWVIIYANTQNGSVTRSSFQITDSLPAGLILTAAPTVTVTGAGTSASANAAYNGASSTSLLAAGAVLDVNGIITARIPVRIDPNFEGTLVNQTSATSPSLAAPIASDAADSTSGGLPPGVTLPTDALAVPQTAAIDTTQVAVVNPAKLGLSKAVASITQVTGTIFRVTYQVQVKNLGTQAAPNVQVQDALNLTYPTPTTFTIAQAPTIDSGAALATNAAFNGLSDTRLLAGASALPAGQSAVIRFAVNVTLSGSQADFFNSAFGSSIGGTAPNPGGAIAAPPAGSPPGTVPSYVPLAGTSSWDASNAAPQGASAAELDAAVDPNGNNRANETGENNATVTRLAFAAALRGSVWLDSTPNRTRDALEGGVQGFGVEIINTVTNQPLACIAGVNTTLGCITMPDGRVIFATDANGNYEVLGAPIGNYSVRFRDSGNNVIYGTPVNGSNNPNSQVATARDALNVTLTPGLNLLDQSLPLDPSGVVYDSDPVRRSPIAGATVTFCGPPGFNASTQLVGASSYVINAAQANCASMVVGANGFYQFLLQPAAPAGRYTLTAAAAGYFGPSVAIPPTTPALSPPAGAGTPYSVQTQSTPPTGNQPTLYYLELNLTPTSQDVVHNHIPLDQFTNARLFVSKVASAPRVELGDSLRYTITITAPDAPVQNVTVTDRAPAGFTYIAGTARVNGSVIADPVRTVGSQYTFNVGNVVQATPAQLSYRMRAGVGSVQGDGINRATASSPQGVKSAEAKAQVLVTPGVFTNNGCVIGKVYVDCNNTQMQDEDEVGIPGVRLYMSDGTSIISDIEGKYSICDVKAMTHTLKVDPSTLPEGSRLVTSSSRNVGDAGSLFIDLKGGEMFRADFIEGSCNNRVLEQVKARRSQGEVRSIEREKAGGPALKFESKSPVTPKEGTDSANQPLVKPRQPETQAPRNPNKPNPELGEAEVKQ